MQPTRESVTGNTTAVAHQATNRDLGLQGDLRVAGKTSQVDRYYEGTSWATADSEQARGGDIRGDPSTVITAGASEGSATAKSGFGAQQGRPRPRKRGPASASTATVVVVPPKLAALFRAPLLAPQLDTPVTGSAAAAVASGGSNRPKPRRLWAAACGL